MHVIPGTKCSFVKRYIALSSAERLFDDISKWTKCRVFHHIGNFPSVYRRYINEDIVDCGMNNLATGVCWWMDLFSLSCYLISRRTIWAVSTINLYVCWMQIHLCHAKGNHLLPPRNSEGYFISSVRLCVCLIVCTSISNIMENGKTDFHEILAWILIMNLFIVIMRLMWFLYLYLSGLLDCYWTKPVISQRMWSNSKTTWGQMTDTNVQTVLIMLGIYSKASIPLEPLE